MRFNDFSKRSNIRAFIYLLGLEKIAELEILSILEVSIKRSPGKLIIENVPEDQVSQLLHLRSVEKIYILLGTLSFVSEDELHRNVDCIIKEIEIHDWKRNIMLWRSIVGSKHSIKFRVTVKVRGKSKPTDKTLFSKYVANTITQQFEEIGSHNEISEIEADVQDWNLEFFVNMCKNSFWIGINLTPQALWKNRSYQGKEISLGRTSLKPSICYAMITLLGITNGVILEPMVGSGMIVMELLDMKSFRGVCYCGDNTTVAIQKTTQNIKVVQNLSPGVTTCDVLQWDATDLPLKDNSVNGILTDLPFGKRIANESKVSFDYPKLMEEFFRVLSKKGKLILLTSNVKLMNRIINKDRKWINQNQVRINHGGIECTIFVLAKRYNKS